MYRFLATLFCTLMLAMPSQAEVRLMMGEEPGCVWCARWNDEIGPIYAKTGEGAAAPLRRVDVSLPLPDDIRLMRPVTFTPTFVLLVDGTEVQRLEGYPGEDFFWGLLGQMLEAAEISFEVKSSAEITQ